LKIALKYDDGGQGVIQDLQRRSRPGQRIYVTADRIPYIKNGFGFAVVSTSKGLVTDRQARADKVGGELICTVY
jgi:small subunit ribosomal protein S8